MKREICPICGLADIITIQTREPKGSYGLYWRNMHQWLSVISEDLICETGKYRHYKSKEGLSFIVEFEASEDSLTVWS
jgi:hypothetical protein